MKTIPGLLDCEDERKVTDLIELGLTFAAYASIDGASSDEASHARLTFTTTPPASPAMTTHLTETRVPMQEWHHADRRAKPDVTTDSATPATTNRRRSAPRPLLRRRKLVSLEVFVPSLVVN